MRSILLLLLSLLLINCNSETATDTVGIIDGVRHVHNLAPLWGDDSKIELEFVQKIGEIEGDDENYQLYYPYDIVKDQNGNICILESGKARISIFSPEGKFIRSIGGKGQGPGEFFKPVTFDIDNQGLFYVGQAMIYRISVVDGQGQEIRRIKTKYPGYPALRVLNDNIWIGGGLGYASPRLPSVKDSLLQVYSKDGHLVKKIAEPFISGDSRMYFVEGVTFIEKDKSNEIVCGFAKVNSIRKYSEEGSLLLEFSKPINIDEPVRISNDGTDIYEDLCNSISVDNNNRIWIGTVHTQGMDNRVFKNLIDTDTEYSEFEIFNSDGISLSTISAPVFFNKMRIIGDSLFLIGHENISVYEYRIIEK